MSEPNISNVYQGTCPKCNTRLEMINPLKGRCPNDDSVWLIKITLAPDVEEQFTMSFQVFEERNVMIR